VDPIPSSEGIAAGDYCPDPALLQKDIAKASHDGPAGILIANVGVHSLDSAWKRRQVAVQILMAPVAKEHSVREKIVMPLQWGTQECQNGSSDEREFGYGKSERLAVAMGMKHVIARIDKPPNVCAIGQLPQVQDPWVITKPIDVHEHKPDIWAVLDDGANRGLNEVEVEVSEASMASEDDGFGGNT
jgi:hypothetical protein